jgi:hypothetical protein
MKSWIMSYTSVYDANKIGIDGFYHTGERIPGNWQNWRNVFEINTALSRAKANVRIGPAATTPITRSSPDFINRGALLFIPAIYRTADGIARVDTTIPLRTAFEGLQTFFETGK